MKADVTISLEALVEGAEPKLSVSHHGLSSPVDGIKLCHAGIAKFLADQMQAEAQAAQVAWMEREGLANKQAPPGKRIIVGH